MGVNLVRIIQGAGIFDLVELMKTSRSIHVAYMVMLLGEKAVECRARGGICYWACTFETALVSYS